MKLPIKKKWFDLIKSGEKSFEWRDAHITFICEETGEILKKKIVFVELIDKKDVTEYFTPKELDKLYEDDELVGFYFK